VSAFYKKEMALYFTDIQILILEKTLDRINKNVCIIVAGDFMLV
jgi:hypothetical protein